jgi:hypothetical protein
MKESVGLRRMPNMLSMNIWLSPPMLFGIPTSTSSRGPILSPPQEVIGREITQK